MNTNINLNGYNMKIADNGDGSYSTSIVKPVRETQVVNALAITDTNNHDYTVDTSNMSGLKDLFITNSLNQALTVTLIAYTSDSAINVVLGSKSFNPSTNGLITTSDIALLNQPISKILIRLSCATAPTSGSATVYLEGVSA